MPVRPENSPHQRHAGFVDQVNDLDARVGFLEAEVTALKRSSFGFRWSRAVLAFQNKPIGFGRLRGKMTVDNNNKATQLRVLSCQRPHMRAFHAAWFSFFLAFVGWFAFAPLMPTVKKQLNLSKADIGNANIASVAVTICVRIGIGPILDRFGARRVQAFLLCIAAIPLCCAWSITGATGLIVCRLCIGIAGGCFVPCQFWTSSMFSKSIVGSANAMAGGWGNLGAGFTYIFMPLIFNLMSGPLGLSEDNSWRAALCVPAAMFVLTALPVLLFTDDCPEGKWSERKTISSAKSGAKNAQGPASNAGSALWNVNTVTLVIHYACCFGVELAVNNMLGLFFYNEFKRDGCTRASNPQEYEAGGSECRRLTQTTAALISSLFSLMNLFARALGGFTSDFAMHQSGLSGRFRVQFVCLFFQAIFLYIFSLQNDIGAAIVSLICFSIFVQSAEGATYGIVPYVSPTNVGVVAGLVGAGGNLGAVCWSFLFKNLDSTRDAFQVLALIILIGSFLTVLLNIGGARMLHLGAFHAPKDMGGTESDGEARILSAVDLDAINEEYSWDSGIVRDPRLRSVSMPSQVVTSRQRSGLGGSGPLMRTAGACQIVAPTATAGTA